MMDEKTLTGLRAALDASPDNLELRMVLLGAYLDQDRTADAHQLVRALEPAAVDSADHRVLAGHACLDAEDAESALTWVEKGETAAETLLSARVITAEAFEHEQLASAVRLVWLGIVIYTWVGPGLFRRSLDKELATVRLDERF